MSTQRLAEAIDKLREAYGGLEVELAARPPRCWSTLVDVVAGGPKAKSSDSPRVPLDQPGQLVELPVEALQEALKVTGRDQRRAGALQALANWWPGDAPAESWCAAPAGRRGGGPGNREQTALALSDSAAESRGALCSRFPAAQHALFRFFSEA